MVGTGRAIVVICRSHAIATHHVSRKCPPPPPYLFVLCLHPLDFLHSRSRSPLPTDLGQPRRGHHRSMRPALQVLLHGRCPLLFFPSNLGGGHRRWRRRPTTLQPYWGVYRCCDRWSWCLGSRTYSCCMCRRRLSTCWCCNQQLLPSVWNRRVILLEPTDEKVATAHDRCWKRITMDDRGTDRCDHSQQELQAAMAEHASQQTGGHCRMGRGEETSMDDRGTG